MDRRNLPPHAFMSLPEPFACQNQGAGKAHQDAAQKNKFRRVDRPINGIDLVHLDNHARKSIQDKHPDAHQQLVSL